MAQKMDPTHFSVEGLARVLTAAGEIEITEEMIREDLGEGAPANADGTVNIIEYTAWLLIKLGYGAR